MNQIIRWAMVALCAVSISNLSSQVILDDATWVRSDTILSNRQVLRNGLLEVHWASQSPYLAEIGSAMDALKKAHPWLSIIGTYIGSERSPAHVERWSDLNDLHFPTQIEGSWPNQAAENAFISLSLYDRQGNHLVKEEKYSKSAIQSLKNELENLQSSAKSPLMPKVSHYDKEATLSDYEILDNPEAIAFEPIYAQLVISDTGNDRVILCDENGDISYCIGSGRPGKSIGKFDETEVDRPMGLAVHSDSTFIYIADHGNKRILLASMDRQTTEELQIFDEDGYAISLPVSPTRLNISGNRLNITLPEIQSIWTIDISSGKLVDEIGIGIGEKNYHRKKSKLVLGHPVDMVSTDEGNYILDNQTMGLIYEYEERVKLLGSGDMVIASELDILHDTLLSRPYGLKSDGERIFLLNSTGPEQLIRIDKEDQSTSLWSWNTDSLDLGSVSDICWSRNSMFVLDKEKGNIIVASEKGQHFLRLSDLNRLSYGIFTSDKLFLAEPITLYPDEQTSVKVDFLFPSDVALHPSLNSELFGTANSEIFIENGDLSNGSVEFYIFPDFKRNQINLMGEIYLTKVNEPWKIYRRIVQVSIPVYPGANDSKENYLLFDIMEGLSSVD